MMEKQLPKGWVVANVGKLGKQQRGVTYGKGDANTIEFPDSILVLRGGNIQDGKIILNSNDNVFLSSKLVKHEQLIKKGDVIIVSSTGSKALIGKAAHAETNMPNVAFGAFLSMLRPNSEINTSYFDHFFQTNYYRQNIRELSGGVNINNIRREHLEGIEFPLAPLNEQKRIADKLDAIFGHMDIAKEKLERIPELLKKFRQQVLTQAVTGKLTEEWREGNEMKIAPQINNIIPLNWQELQFEAIIADGPQNGMYKPQSAYGEGIMILRIDNFYEGKVNPWYTLKTLKVSNDEIHKYGLANDDIIINRVNSMSHLGKSAIIEDLTSDCVFESNMMRIRLNKQEIYPQYIIKYLNSSIGISQLQKNAKQAVNQASINQTDVKAVYVILPPVEEQKEIVKRVDELFALADNIEAQYNILMKKAETLPQAVLSKAFRGELVPQDPNDEPASALLERINKNHRKHENKKSVDI